jgi:hypothetical protein
MGIKGLNISMIVSISFDTESMPRLNPKQREQAIGRLHAGQPARVIANDFKPKRKFPLNVADVYLVC